MYDVVSLYLSDEMVRYVVVWTIAVSALMVFVMAFAVTRGAGFGCPLALLRGAQRVFLCALAISLAYVGAFIAEYAAAAVPLGPLLILFLCFMTSTLISGIRHLLAPAVAIDNTWDDTWRFLREKARNVLLDQGPPRMVPPVRQREVSSRCRRPPWAFPP